MAKVFLLLKLCPSLLSKSIVVDICKNIPMTIAIISLKYEEIEVIYALNIDPKGVVNAKIVKRIYILKFDIFLCRSKCVNTIPTGIL